MACWAAIATGLIQAFTSKDVLSTNNSTLTITAYTVNDGNGGADYTLTTHTATGTITPAALSINAVTDSKVYDSTTTSSKTPTVNGLPLRHGDWSEPGVHLQERARHQRQHADRHRLHGQRPRRRRRLHGDHAHATGTITPAALTSAPHRRKATTAPPVRQRRPRSTACWAATRRPAWSRHSLPRTCSAPTTAP